MAVQLEQEIMMAIGLGNHYSWYNGSGSCGYIAREAIGLLPKAIQKAVDDNKEIAPPMMNLINQLRPLPDKDGKYGLTDTWVACSYVIQEHIYEYYRSK